MKEIPEHNKPVLAEVRHQNSLGESQWYEVVYFNEFGWSSYSGSDTFGDGERVVNWKYCKRFINQGART